MKLLLRVEALEAIRRIRLKYDVCNSIGIVEIIRRGMLFNASILGV